MLMTSINNHSLSQGYTICRAEHTVESLAHLFERIQIGKAVGHTTLCGEFNEVGRAEDDWVRIYGWSTTTNDGQHESADRRQRELVFRLGELNKEWPQQSKLNEWNSECQKKWPRGKGHQNKRRVHRNRLSIDLRNRDLCHTIDRNKRADK